MTMIDYGKEREAESAWTPDSEGGWTAGPGYAVKRIVVYLENVVPWIRIEHHDGRTTYADARHYEITFPAEVSDD